MNYKAEINGIKIDLFDQEPYEIKHLNFFVYPAMVEALPDGKNSLEREKFNSLLVGQKIFDEEIKGVESFALGYVGVGHSIGIAFSNKIKINLKFSK
jgi:hypothetical protein